MTIWIKCAWQFPCTTCELVKPFLLGGQLCYAFLNGHFLKWGHSLDSTGPHLAPNHRKSPFLGVKFSKFSRAFPQTPVADSGGLGDLAPLFGFFSFFTETKFTIKKLVLRWFETVFHFPLQLNFMKGLLVCSKRLLLLVDSRCCNNVSTYQLLYPHWHFGCHGNLTGPQIHPISSIQLHFTQKVVSKLPFLLHQNCLHIKEHFLRKFKKILSRSFGATLIFCNI